MTTALSPEVTQTVPPSYSGTDVQNVKRIKLQDVRESYCGLECWPDFDRPIVLRDREISTACPAYAVAAYWMNKPPIVLLAASRNRDDFMGHIRVAMALDLDPDYILGHILGWFGRVPRPGSVAESIGWRDGAECYRELSA